MSITAISASNPYSQKAHSINPKARTDFAALRGDVQSGNMAAAQTDFAALLQDAPQLQAQLAGSPATPAQTSFSSLAAAVQAGDVAGAQKAMAALQQNGPGHHHHHHHQGAQDADGTVAASPAASPVSGA